MAQTTPLTGSNWMLLRRLGATLLDIPIVFIGMYVVAAAVELIFGEGKIASYNAYMVMLFGPALYGAWGLSMGKGGTIGQEVFGLKVVGPDGKRLGFWRGFGRTMVAWYFFFGFVWALFDAKGQALHDKLVGAVVVKN